MITFDDFSKLEIKIGKVLSCEKVENADKLLKLIVDFGPASNPDGNQDINEVKDSGPDFVETTPGKQASPDQIGARMTENKDRETRQIVSGIAEYYQPEELVGKLIPVLTNLEPRTFRGIESQGMILAADNNGKPTILKPESQVPPGSRVK